MKFAIKLIFGGLLAISLLTACSKDNDPEPEPGPVENNLILIASTLTDQGAMEVSLYAKDSLFAGYNNVYVKVKNASGAYLTQADVMLHPMMDMGGMMHSSPAEDPATSAVDNIFQGAVIFTMPGVMGWTIDVTVYDPVMDVMGTAALPVSVKSPPQARVRVVTPLDGSDPLVITYVQPQKPKTGTNPFEITLHRKASMMDFPADDNLSVEIDPQMLAMGHGSPNNVDPTLTANGHYSGSVNFTMSGDWRIYLKVMDGTAVVDSTAWFDVTF